ncbi:MAG TPA: hypothetical protein DCY79_00335 [Planctomycetaceae bacterium]|nr:hypothetical protein [Planctomycetaceae bacterium]
MSNDLQKQKRFDCLFCGEICVDVPIRPIDRGRPLDEATLLPVEPITLGGGGSVPNSGIAFAKMGLRSAALGCVGDDVFGRFILDKMSAAGMDVSHVVTRAELPTSATAVLGGEDGEHTFAYHGGASRAFDRHVFAAHREVFQEARFALFGYYSLMPQLEDDLPDLLAEVQGLGCQTALDAAGGGGAMQPLDRILPHLDIYVPSYGEAQQQTQCDEPRAMIERYRAYCPKGLLGVKLGARGALLQTREEEWIEVAPVQPPGPVVDTTGAGDCFYAGLIAGLAQGLSPGDAGRIAAAAGACSVTGVGAVEGMVAYTQLAAMATKG